MHEPQLPLRHWFSTGAPAASAASSTPWPAATSTRCSTPSAKRSDTKQAALTTQSSIFLTR